MLRDGRLVSGCADGTIKIWPKEGVGEPVLLSKRSLVYSLTQLADGRLVSGDDVNIKIWPREGTGEPVVLTHGGGVLSLTTLPDGRLASGDTDGTSKLWLVDEQQLVAALCLRAECARRSSRQPRCPRRYD